MLSKYISLSSDYIGAVSSGLCLIHCLATPFIFFAKSCTATTSCCADAPLAWSLLDFLFIGISFFAVCWSVKHTSKAWMKYALWTAWILSFLVIFNEQFLALQLPDYSLNYSAFLLIGLHLYNHKYCKCGNDSCCVHGK